MRLPERPNVRIVGLKVQWTLGCCMFVTLKRVLMGRPKRDDTSGVIYMITFPNGKRYVGLTATSFEERKASHISHRRTSNLPVHNALERYLGSEEWEVVAEGENWDELTQLEIYYIDKYKTHTSLNGYNLTFGGDGTVGYEHTDEQRQKNSVAKQKYFSDSKNRIKQSIATKNAYATNPQQAERHSQFQKLRFSDPQERERVAQGMREYLSDKENLRKHAMQRGAKEFLVETKDGIFVGVWLTQNQCARDLNLSVSHVNQCLKGKRKTHKGYVFKYT